MFFFSCATRMLCFSKAYPGFSLFLACFLQKIGQLFVLKCYYLVHKIATQPIDQVFSTATNTMFAVVFKRALNIQAIISQLSFSQTPTKSFHYRQNNGSIFFLKSLIIISGNDLAHIFPHCVKSIPIRSYSDPHFPACGLNTERYDGVSLFIQSECGKMWTRITPNTDTFYSVPVLDFDT